MIKKYKLLAIALLLSSQLFSQSYQQTSTGVLTNALSLDIEIQFYTPQIVRILKYPQGKAVQKQSLSVIKVAEQVEVSVAQSENLLTVQSQAVKVTVDLQTAKVSFADEKGNSLFTEKDKGTQFTDFSDAGNPTYSVRQAFLLDKDEAIYGLGQQQVERLNQRNHKHFMRQRALLASVPIIQSTKGYGMFWDNYSPTTYVDNPWEMSFDSEVGQCLDYYFMYGATADGVIAQIRQLTGQAPMFPLWTYGFWQSRERYKSQAETMEVVDTYRKLGVPLDGIIQDWQYWGPDTNWNSMNFDNPTFANPQAMIDHIHQKNAHIMISVWASFGPDTKQFKEMKAKNMLIDFDTWPPNAGVKPYDPYNTQAREIYWDYLNKGLFSKGIDAWWTDSTEPDHLNVKEQDFDKPTALGTFRSVRNAFPLMSNKGVYENQRATTATKRVYQLTRCAFAGQQRYATNTWSGDVVANWSNFARQIPTGLNFSLSGIPYWNTDIGGFFLWEYEGGATNKAYHELYTRWFQYGTFLPMQRSHGTDGKKEIYQFGQRGDWAFDSEEKYINLRYALLPYMYSTAWAVTNHSGSFLRALFMDFKEDKATHALSDQYLFGKSFLVKPVTQQMYVTPQGEKNSDAIEDFSSTKNISVYLPQGSKWFDFWTGQVYDGGQSISKAVPIDIIPLYVKAGSIVPWGAKVQYATQKRWDNLEIRIYPGANGEFVLYEDENDNYNYEQGKYTTITFKWDNNTRTLTLGDCKGAFTGMLKSRKFNIVLVDAQNNAGNLQSTSFSKTISYSGKGKSIKL